MAMKMSLWKTSPPFDRKRHMTICREGIADEKEKEH